MPKDNKWEVKEKMKLRELQHFIAIVEHGNFSKAAANIYVSQPTLSKSIKKLEEKLHVHLFRRSTRTLELTDAGHIVYQQALKILGETEELSVLLDNLTHVPSGEIKMGIPPVIGTLFFPKIASTFGKLYPKVSLKLVEHGAKRIELLVDEGKVDVGLIVLPTTDRHFHITPFIEEEFFLFTPLHHHLANEKIIRTSQLQDEKFIVFNKEFALHKLIIQHCQQAGFQPKIAYESSQWDLITELVRANLGITLLPKSIRTKMVKDTTKMIPLETPPMWNLGVITKKDRYQSFAVRALIQYLEENGGQTL